VCNFLNPDEIFLGVVGVSVSDTFRAWGVVTLFPIYFLEFI
jgi:hypothetical protein